METRRQFLLQAGAAAGAAGLAPAAGRAQERAAAGSSFRLLYAPHFGMFRNHAGDDPIAQLEFAHAEGFRAWEDNGMAGRPVAEQERIARAMERLDMRMGVFVANFQTAFGKKSFSSGDPGLRDTFLGELRSAVEVAKRVNATWMTVVLGDLDPRLPLEYQHGHALDTLRRGAEILEPHGLVMVLEPLNPWRDHPGMYLQRSPQAWMLCRAVGSPAVKILFDIYHQQITEGNLIPNIDRCWEEIGYFQIGDNPGRQEPFTGEIHYPNVFRHIHGKGYTGILGMEHGVSMPGRDGERLLIERYRRADAFPA